MSKFRLSESLPDSAISLNYEGFAGLEPMILKFANMTWQRIPESHRRHIDKEDILQETRMRAFAAIASYDPGKTGLNGKTAKLSSWVYGTLALRMREVNAPFTDPTRNQSRSGIVVGFDEAWENPFSTYEPVFEMGPHLHDSLESFEQAYKESDTNTQQMFLDTLGLRTKIRISPKRGNSVALDIATKCRLTPTDLRTLRSHGTERCVIVAAKLSKGGKLPQIECVKCSNSFSVTDVGKTIDARTLVCSNCYAEQSESELTCFAKEYEPTAPECSGLCPDRTVCAEVSTKGAYMGIKVSNSKSGKTKSTPAVKPASEIVDDPFADEPLEVAGYPVGSLTIGSEQLEVEDNSIDGHDDEPADGEFDEPLEEVPEELEVHEPAHADEPLDTAADDPFLDTAVEEKPKPATAAKPSRQKEQVVIVPAKPTPVKVAQKKVPVKAVPAKKAVVVVKAKPVVKAAAPVKVAAKPVKAAKPAPAKTAALAKAGKKAKRVLKAFKPQYWTGQHPFRPGTALHKIAEKLLTPPGVKLNQLIAYVAKQGLNWRGVRHNLAKGASFNGQWEWKFKIADDDAQMVTMKITKHPDAEYKKECGEPVKPVVKAKAKAKGKK